jgi:hemerythrin-like domain-containing protein
MQDAISIIKDEHISISSVLKGLVTHVEDALDAKRDFDPFLVSAMLDYIETVPERVHHPKEDQYLFRLLRKRTDKANEALDQLEEEHQKSKVLLNDMRVALAQCKKDGDLKNFFEAMNSYSRFHFAHMRKEEKDVFPLAVEYLTAEDWHEIHEAFRLNMKVDMV